MDEADSSKAKSSWRSGVRDLALWQLPDPLLRFLSWPSAHCPLILAPIFSFIAPLNQIPTVPNLRAQEEGCCSCKFVSRTESLQDQGVWKPFA